MLEKCPSNRGKFRDRMQSIIDKGNMKISDIVDKKEGFVGGLSGIAVDIENQKLLIVSDNRDESVLAEASWNLQDHDQNESAMGSAVRPVKFQIQNRQQIRIDARSSDKEDISFLDGDRLIISSELPYFSERFDIANDKARSQPFLHIIKRDGSFDSNLKAPSDFARTYRKFTKTVTEKVACPPSTTPAPAKPSGSDSDSATDGEAPKEPSLFEIIFPGSSKEAPRPAPVNPPANSTTGDHTAVQSERQPAGSFLDAILGNNPKATEAPPKPPAPESLYDKPFRSKPNQPPQSQPPQSQTPQSQPAAPASDSTEPQPAEPAATAVDGKATTPNPDGPKVGKPKALVKQNLCDKSKEVTYNGEDETGLRDNKGLEGMAVLRGTDKIFFANEFPLIQDKVGYSPAGNMGALYVRIYASSFSEMSTTEPKNYFKYRTDRVLLRNGVALTEAEIAAKQKNSQTIFGGVVAMAALSETELLVMERAWEPGAAESTVRIYKVDTESLENDYLKKTLILDFVDIKNQLASGFQRIDNFEGMALGPIHENKQVIFFVSDNNFNIRQRTVLLALEVPLDKLQLKSPSSDRVKK